MSSLNLSKLKEIKLPKIEDWGLIDYKESLDKQRLYVEEILSGQRWETIVFCHHPPVVTMGRGTQSGDVFSWQGEKFEINRGGRATYHGPGQLVMYPIIDLGGQSPFFIKKKIKKKDLREYLGLLEKILILTLRDYGVKAQGGQCLQKQNNKQITTGVWTDSGKLASIGIGVKKWITYHGMAVNLFRDNGAFEGIKPCGFDSDQMIFLEEFTEQRIKRKIFQKELTSNFIFLIYTDFV